MLGCSFSKANQQKIGLFFTEEHDASLLAIVCLDICGFNFIIITREGLGESCVEPISVSVKPLTTVVVLSPPFVCGLQRCFFPPFGLDYSLLNHPYSLRWCEVMLLHKQQLVVHHLWTVAKISITAYIWSAHSLHILFCSFYNYKSLESAVAPNVALTPLQKGGQASPTAPSSSHPHGAESEGASRGRKRRQTGETNPSPQPCPSAIAGKPLPPFQEARDSDVEVEVESREECEYMTHLFTVTPPHSRNVPGSKHVKMYWQLKINLDIHAFMLWSFDQWWQFIKLLLLFSKTALKRSSCLFQIKHNFFKD